MEMANRVRLRVKAMFISAVDRLGSCMILWMILAPMWKVKQALETVCAMNKRIYPSVLSDRILSCLENTVNVTYRIWTLSLPRPSPAIHLNSLHMRFIRPYWATPFNSRGGKSPGET